MGVLNHFFVSTVADGPYPTQVQPSNWNQGHTFSGGNYGAVLVRDTTNPSSSEGASWVSTLAGAPGAIMVSPNSSSLPLWWDGFARCSSQTDVTGSGTLANVTGLALNLAAGRTYQFSSVLFTQSSSASGVKFAVSGTCTATAIIYEGLTVDGTAISARTRATTLGSTVGNTNTVTAAVAEIYGTITVANPGTLTIQFAQNSSTTATSSVLQGSTLTALQIG